MFLFFGGLDIEAFGFLDIGALAFGRDGPADAVAGHLADSSAFWTIVARLGRELRNALMPCRLREEMGFVFSA